MKRFNTLSLFLLLALTLQAQIPTAWQTKYATCNGLKGAALKTALYQIIASHTQKSYNALWECYETTDVHTNGTIWDMYSTLTDGVLYPTDHSGNYSVEGDLLNREHSVPSSWFDKAYPMYSDLFHVIPTDGYINGMRSNYPYGETSNPTKTSSGGFSKLGPCDAAIGYTGTVFEPNDEYKGDLARNYFYMATCYEDNVATWTSDMFGNTTYPAFTSWAQTMLVRWATTDVVSAKEIARNEAVYAIQGNRNPFIDYPGLEEYIWGSKTNQAVNLLADGTIEETDQEASGNDSSDSDLYEEVTSTDQLVAGKQYIIVYPTGSLAMKYDGSNFKGLSYAGHISNSKIDISSLTDISVLTLGGTTDAWTFAFTYNNATLYLQCAAKNTLTTSATATANAQLWTIDPTATNPIVCNNVINSTTYYLQYNTSDYFRCYAATQQSVKLYVQCESSEITTVEAPTFSQADESELVQGTTVTLSCATAGATIQYSTDGGTTWTTGSSITLNTLGTTTIQAKAVLNSIESSITEVSYSIIAPSTCTFQQITSTDDLEVGARYLIVNETNGKTLGTQTNNNFSAASITITDHTTTITDDGSIQILTLGGEADAYTFLTPSSTYLTLGSNNNYLRTATSVSDNDQRWTIAFESTGNVTILNKSYTTREIKYNSGSTLFACYTSGQQKCQLYKEVLNIPVDVPTFSPDGGTINAGADITITAVGTDANVMYKIDDAATWSGGTSQTAIITLTTTGTHTITAKSVSTNNESTSVSKTFTVVEHTAEYYERIYSTDDLVDGWEYLIVYSSEGVNKAIGSWSGKSSYTALDATIVNDKIDLADDTEGLGIVTLVSSTNGTFALQVSNNYFGYSGSSTNLSTSSSLSSDNFRWNISITNGIAQIQNAGTNTRYLGYGAATTPVSFKAYTSGSNTNLQIFAKRSSSFNISKWGWGTYYDQRAYTMPEGVTGVTITDGLADVESLEVGNTYNAGDIVPGNTALLLYGDGGESGTDYDFNFYYPADKPANYSGTSNLLHGSMSGVTAAEMLTESGVSSDDYYFYKLTTKGGANVGFYWGAEGGVPFQMNSGHKCWLTLLKTKGAATLGFALDLDNLINNGKITTINTVPSTTSNQPSAIYDLQGRRVTKPISRGIYIINGKKTFIP